MSNQQLSAGSIKLPLRRILVIGGIVLAVLLIFSMFSSFVGYAFRNVRDNQVGVRFDANRPYDVVGPGFWTDLRPFQSIQTVSTNALHFEVGDPEVLTKDQQRIGVTVSGDVFRPGKDKAEILIQNWGNYRTYYLDDEALIGVNGDAGKPGLMANLGQQAMKVCVGDLNFSEAVVGSARDTLRTCIDTALSNLADGYGLDVKNVVVPNVALGEAVQKKLDEITQSRYETQLAQQNALKAQADADRDLAIQQGQIRVEQGRVQEKAIQDAKTAQLNKQTLEAQRAVIEAQKANDLFEAQKNLEIADARRLAAEKDAAAALAPELAKAKMLQDNPAYVDLQKTQALAAAWKETDKIIVPAGTSPVMIVGDGTTPVQVPVNGQ